MKPKRPNLRWKGAAGYYDHGGRPRRWEHLGNDEATVLARWERIHAQHAPEHGTVDRMVAEYLERPREPLKPGTLRNYRIFRGHLAAVFGNCEPHTVTQGEIVRYLRACPRKTARGEIGLLSLAYVNWIDEQRLDFNPCFGVKVRLPTSRRDRLLSFAELDAIIRAAPEQIAVAIELAYATGLRIGDLCRLTWADVAEIVRTQKTGARQRFEGTDALVGILDRCRALQARVGSLYVLCARAGRQWKPDGLRRRWVIACAKAGVEDANFHDIRSVGATEIESLHGRQAAQAYLGHRNPQTTERYLRDKRANVVTAPARRKA